MVEANLARIVTSAGGVRATFDGKGFSRLSSVELGNNKGTTSPKYQIEL